MSLYYLWSWDVAREGAMTMSVTVGAETTVVTVSSGVLVHSRRMPYGPATLTWPLTSSLQGLAETLDGTVVGAHPDDVPTLRVRWTPGVGYTLFVILVQSGEEIGQLDFGIDFSTHGAAGERMRRALGFSGDRVAGDMIVQNFTPLSGNAHRSDVRPIYQINPAVEGRSNLGADEYEPDDVVTEAVADSGETAQVSRAAEEIWVDWTQAADVDEQQTDAFGPGTPSHRRYATTEIPWTYQDAWRHMKRGQPTFLVVDSGMPAAFSGGSYTMRADGLSFRPQRFQAEDTPLFSHAFRTRLIGNFEAAVP